MNKPLSSPSPLLLCMGEAMAEYNQQPDGRYLQGFGGDTSNAAISAARQGARAGIFTHIGSDPAGDGLLALWQGEGIETDLVKRCPDAQTGIYFVTHDSDGHHFSYYRKMSAAAQMTADDVPQDKLAGVDILHISGISQAISDSASQAVIAAIRAVKSAGGRVSYDTNLRLGLWSLEKARQTIHDTVAECDIALPGLDDARQLTGLNSPDEIADFYLQLGVSIVALTLGPNGTMVASKKERAIIPSFAVDAIDATAAGDTFDGAFLAELMAGASPFDAAKYANATAALSTTGYGAVAPIPHRAQVEKFIKGQSVA
ncbi:MAG: sugar kinase [Candidatus Puniceispirillaceae bacterium]